MYEDVLILNEETEHKGVGVVEGLAGIELIAVWAVLGISLLCIAYAFVLRGQVLAQDKGTARMQEVWSYIKQGANAYLARQFRIIIISSLF